MVVSRELLAWVQGQALGRLQSVAMPPDLTLAGCCPQGDPSREEDTDHPAVADPAGPRKVSAPSPTPFLRECVSASGWNWVNTSMGCAVGAQPRSAAVTGSAVLSLKGDLPKRDLGHSGCR